MSLSPTVYKARRPILIAIPTRARNGVPHSKAVLRVLAEDANIFHIALTLERIPFENAKFRRPSVFRTPGFQDIEPFLQFAIFWATNINSSHNMSDEFLKSNVLRMGRFVCCLKGYSGRDVNVWAGKSWRLNTCGTARSRPKNSLHFWYSGFYLQEVHP
uniref:Uncharacterized protein n=1 Tax=Ascaris lumbricoides TaxID=6252 RepID=A0A0M3HL42_ASCLU